MTAPRRTARPGGAPPQAAASSAAADAARQTVLIEGLERDGRGKAVRNGRAVLLPQAYPGEAVAFRTDVSTLGALQGRPLKVLKASPDRVPHPCTHEFHCTGCPLLSYRPEAEGRFKTGLVRKAAAGIPSTGQDPVRPLIASPAPFGYRHYGKQHFARRDGRVVLGSYVQGTHRVADNRGCPVLAPALAATFDRLADLVSQAGLPLHAPEGERGLRHAVARHSKATGRIQLVLATSEPEGVRAEAFVGGLAAELPVVESAFLLVQQGEGNFLLEGDPKPIFGPPELEETLLGKRFLIGPKSFFQINPWGAETLFTRAAEAAGTGDVVLELFSGVGALTLKLADGFRRVVAAEASAEAADCARRNAARNGAAHVEVRTARAEEAAATLLREISPEAVVVDPPRKGLGPQLAGLLAASSAKTIVLLSCDPQALQRDATALAAGGRRLDLVQPVDQFPRTAHVETVARFT
ncbi:MAG TPA: 23S rRNA (uracil(1939)-C(5))-methyltransferase RlmD [Planctomycetota bacterium]|nr:23S rRNA (uracil(1939)-C(5))-methyltransferase RlmD [Planctomycetota bacterium]